MKGSATKLTLNWSMPHNTGKTQKITKWPCLTTVTDKREKRESAVYLAFHARAARDERALLKTIYANTNLTESRRRLKNLGETSPFFSQALQKFKGRYIYAPGFCLTEIIVVSDEVTTLLPCMVNTNTVAENSAYSGRGPEKSYRIAAL
ncbi:hypothetical protein TRVL_09547 [Trypanosoma vivax]|nr:hypothetical protein TRVL_09547 [Trypanosoma vivax]